MAGMGFNTRAERVIASAVSGPLAGPRFCDAIGTRATPSGCQPALGCFTSPPFPGSLHSNSPAVPPFALPYHFFLIRRRSREGQT